MSRNYKYDFADQVLIHAQRPDASACAEYDVWTGRMGRYVRRGAKGIALVDYSGDAPRLRYVFDVSDTGVRRSSRPFRPWAVNDENLVEVQLGLKQDFGADGEWLSGQLQDAARDLAEMYFDAHRHDIGAIVDGSFMAGYDESELRDSFIRAASVSTAYTLISRCGYDPEAYFAPDDFAFLTEWNTPSAATALGSAVSENTQLVLREIERTIRSYERSQRHDRNKLHDSERRTDSRPDHARDGADRPVREDASEVSAGALPGAVEPPRAGGNAVRASTRDRDSGAEPHRPDAAETGSGSGRDGGAEGRRSAEVDGSHEQLQSPGRRNSSQRVNLQLNLFDEAEDADAPSAFSCPQEVIDDILRVGENTSYLRERVVAEFEKQRSLDEIAAFLPTVYHGGVGVVVDGEQYVAWMSTDGIRIAQGNTARYERDAQIISWETAAERISELLDTGQYAGSWELERTAATERELLAQQIVYLYRDLADGQNSNFFPSFDSIKSGLFPDVTERVAAMLSDREQCETLIAEYRDFLKAYRADRSVLRFNYHNTNEILSSLESQLLPRVQFHADTELIPSPHQFITQDEIDKLLRDGGSTSGGKWQIFRYFTGEHSVEDKADILKREYGIGGRSHALSDAPGSDEKHDSKGMELSKGGCENVRLTWRQIARRIDTLIASDRFMTAAELAMYDTHTAAYASYNRAKPYHNNDIVLVQYGGAFYTYGADAETAAHALGQRTRQAGGLDYVEIMEEQIEPALDALRTYKPVTFSYENGTELTVDFHLPGDMRAQYEQRLYDALMSNESYANAVMNSDEENATLTGERVLREFAADSDDRDFQRAYYDNPHLREALNRAALDAAYHDLSEPPSEDEPAVRPRDPMASAYGVGDFVWYEGREYQITDLQRGYVELLPPGMTIPVYRTERRADFELGLRFDERNRYITDYLSAELNDDARDYVSAVLTPEDRTQISAWLRAGEGNAQIAGRLAEMFAGRDGAEPDGLHYRIPDDAGNIVATGFVPWEQLAGAARGMYREDSWTFEHGSSAERTYNEVKTAHLDSLVLIQDSDVMRAYGDDAVEIAAALGLNVTDGVLSFPVSELREYTDVLRKEHNITIFASDGREQFIAADTPRIAVTDAYIDAALVRWGDLSVKANAGHAHVTGGVVGNWREHGVNRPNRPNTNEPFHWNSSTIITILSRQEYCGDLINFKTYSKSYKNKKRIENDRENWVIFKDVHEAIVPRELWERVQQKRAGVRKRQTNKGEHNMFSGLLVCSDCGHNLHYHFNSRNPDITYFSCPNTKSERGTCKGTHYIRIDFLEQVVLGEIRRLTKFVSQYETQFAKLMMGFTQQAMETERKQVQLELSKAKARDRELDTLFEKLYEDNVAGKISDERFVRMSKKYELEQEELRSSIKALQANIERIDSKAATVDMFISAVRKYTRARKLTPRMLNELIDKIEVHQADKVNGVWRQRLTIHYNCVGAITLPDTATIRAPHVTMNTRQGVYVTYEPDTPAPAADTASA